MPDGAVEAGLPDAAPMDAATEASVEDAATDGGDAALPDTIQAKALSVGLGYACAIRQDDSVTCWGDALPSETPAPIGQSYVTPFPGALHLCGLTIDGHAAC